MSLFQVLSLNYKIKSKIRRATSEQIVGLKLSKLIAQKSLAKFYQMDRKGFLR